MKTWRKIMKLRDGGTTILIILAVVAVGGYLSSRWLGHDNVIEETAENVIEQHTGVDIDLSPNSPDGEHHRHSDSEHKKASPKGGLFN
jgi:hypothetical protein